MSIINADYESALAKIDDYFPFGEFRDGQRKPIELALEKFLKSKKKFFILEAPVGTGKSPIAFTIAQYFRSGYYLTSSKILQDQLIEDFGSDKTVDLKGRNAYPCTYWDTLRTTGADNELEVERPPGRVGCDEGACKQVGDSKCKLCVPKEGPALCPYFRRLREAQRAHLTVLNFSSFLFQTHLSHQLPHRELLIIDECHNTEPQLMNFVGMNLNDTFLKKKFPKYDKVSEYLKWFEEIGLDEIINNNIRIAKYANDLKDVDYWNSIATKYDLLRDADHDDWVVSYKTIRGGSSRRLEFKPVFIRKYATDYLFKRCKKVMLMSATVLDPRQMCDALGIEKDEVYAYRMQSRFPIKNRPIHLTKVGSMSYRNKHQTMPKLIKKVTELCRKHNDIRGIIHTHNFEIAEKLKYECPRDVSSRFAYQKDFRSKNDMLAEHARKSNSIIIAPAMHEGLDLKGDLGEFAIICKVPYPSFQDNPQLKKRMELSQSYYDWLTALKLVQSYGRIIRSPTDVGATYVVDSDIDRFLKNADKMIPKWFKEAIVN
jgi:ATP-dependent DNA helicase DinG